MTSSDFDLRDFTPYLLNMAAEASSLRFQKHYRDRYGMLRTEWRVLFHLGRYGAMHAKEICEKARTHKTKVSRAVAALEKKHFLSRTEEDADRRSERLTLTPRGQKAFDELYREAKRFDEALTGDFNEAERETLRKCLQHIARL
jgi:DNA-binding MarR family transcriptional regulator